MAKIQQPRKLKESPAPAPAKKRWNPHALRLLLLWALVLGAYSNSFHAPLVFDNVGIVLQDPRIRAATAQNIGSILTEGYWRLNPDSGLYRPLTTLSYLANYAVFDNGTDPAGYHWVNFALHGVNVSLVYSLGLAILSEPALAVALAAIWGLHPLLTDSVTNIVGRADLLAAFGVLAGLLCYIRWISEAGPRAWRWLVGMAAAQAVGLFSKENAAMLPALALLYDLAFSGRVRWRSRAPAAAALALPFAAFLYMRSHIHTRMLVALPENPLAGADFWTARLTAVKVIGKYLSLFLWPARLSPDYSYRAFPLFGWNLASWEDQKTLIALIVSAAAILLALALRRRSKPAFFFILFFFVALLPTANLVLIIGSIMAERFLYLPAIGLAGCLVAGIDSLARQLPASAAIRRPAWIALAILGVSCAARTYARNADWRSDLSLWSSAVAVCPEAARPHMNLGNALADLPGRLPEAITEYRAAIRILPDGEQEHYNLGQALARMPGQSEEAMAEFQTALRLKPDAPDAHYNLGLLFEQSGRIEDALAQFQAAIRSRPDFALAHNNLGNVLERLPGRHADAIAEWREATAEDPDLAQAHYNLANALSEKPDRLAEAIGEYRAALRADPGLAEAHNNLANALAKLPNRMRDAVAEWQLALRIQPDLVQAHLNLATALAAMPGQRANAIAELEAAERIRPDPQVRQLLDQLHNRRE